MNPIGKSYLVLLQNPSKKDILNPDLEEILIFDVILLAEEHGEETVANNLDQIEGFVEPNLFSKVNITSSLLARLQKG